MKNFKLLFLAIISIAFFSCEKEKSNINTLYSFWIEDIEIHGLAADNIINIYVPYGTDYSQLVAMGQIPEGATIYPEFGTTLDFTNDVNFVVTAEDGSQREYVVKLFVESITDFEDLELDESGYWNGSDGTGEFISENISFKNSYNNDWASWSGFAYSSLTDKSTAGWGNQYSTYGGASVTDSEKFGLSYQSSEMVFTTPMIVEEASFTNSTYAALSMKDGDDYAKKFGGEDGSEEDWFLLTIEGFDENENSTGTFEVYLADYRFYENVEDYILDDWYSVNLSSLGEVKKLTFNLSSSDNGDWGMNTPGYFCIDNIYGIVRK